MPESNGQAIAQGPNGQMWVRHGAVTAMSLLDGFSVKTLREPRWNSTVNWSLVARVNAGADNDAWTVEDNALKHFVNGAWTVLATQARDEKMIAAIPVGSDRVMVLYVDRLAELDWKSFVWKTIRTTRDTSIAPFRAMVQGFFGDVWIAAAHGLARVEALPGQSDYRWSEHDGRTAGLQDFIYPLPSPDGSLFVVGQVGTTRSRQLVRWQGAQFAVILTAREELRGWQGEDGSVWVIQGESLFHLTGSSKHKVERRGPLSSKVVDVITERNGAFWLSTGDAVARYAPPIWRTPAPVSAIDIPVHSIVEDTQGHLWFSSTDRLIELDGTTWKVYPFPSEHYTDPLHTENMTVLPDGRVVLRITKPLSFLLAFDPKSQRFSRVRESETRAIWLATRRPDGTLLLETGPPPWEGCRIELYDGKTFRLLADLGEQWQGGDVRSLMQATDGALWIGGTAGAGVYRNGVYRPLTAVEGFLEKGGLAFMEDRAGEILAGGRDALLRFDGRGWTTWQPGFDRVRNIVQLRDGSVWVASGNGVHRFENGSWITNGEAEGLPSNVALKVFQDSQGRIWAGTTRGISLYYPNADRDAPRAILSSGSNPSEVSSQGNIRLVFAGIDKWQQTAADRLLYSYRLDEGAWSEFSTETGVSFRGLKPDKHQIELRAMDRNGNISPASEPFRFAVALPWYRQIGFLVVGSFSATCILILLRVARGQYVALRRSKLAAEAASRAKSQFLANMSHELRTPMNAIMGMTALAREIAVSEEQQEYLRLAEKSSESLLSLLNDILDVSKVEAGKLELAVVDFDLRENVEDVIRMFRSQANGKAIGLTARIAPGVPRYLAGDNLRLGQVLINLIGNALKFTERGEILLMVDNEPADDGVVSLRFTVADTGIGIPRDKQVVIFDPFEQADKTTTRKYGGTGLGLAISAGLVRLMHGRIGVASPWRHPITGEMVTGSAFDFTARFGRGRQSERTVTEPSKSTRPMRILLAEDNEVNRLVASRMLEKAGHLVIPAHDGREAVAAFSRDSVDLILMDIQMPLMDGFEATATIRKGENGGGHVPIVGLTAHASQGDRERCLQAGMDRYLTKPIKREALLSTIAEFAEICHAVQT
jgi:signal transduction histidine kinase/CheY-like chemotaxis protein